ncbi:MAG: galactokinase [Candidatus Niyogibacteria bacterium]|nr:MAG: galactokinase [Candidatus Niyogibacteria bacterium]
MSAPMIFSRTPFRISLGGGSTDLPSYSRKFGGFIFGFAIQMYMDIFVRKPVIYDRVDLQYLEFESEESPEKLRHPIARTALNMIGIKRAVSIYFKSDTPMGTGLGSSGACAVGLLNALYKYTGIEKSQHDLAEDAFTITQDLGLPDGKQDPYLTALGGFIAIEIDQNDKARFWRPEITEPTVNLFLANTLFFYSGIKRESTDILRSQEHGNALALKHKTKEIGRQILRAFTAGNLEDFGRLMHEHWILKKEMSDKITSPELDDVYGLAIKNGALGGKLIGAGGGGYFLFYCPDEGKKQEVSYAMRTVGFREIPIAVDKKGTRVQKIDF